jgi:hypothetical protein
VAAPVSTRRRSRRVIAAATALCLAAAVVAAAALHRPGHHPGTPASSPHLSQAVIARQSASDATSPYGAATTFNYGFDFTTQGPDAPLQTGVAKANNAQAVTSAVDVLSRFAGSMMDQSIFGFGAQHNPEPRPGVYDFRSIAARVNLIVRAGGIPVITLTQAPSWMYTGCKEGRIFGTEDINALTPGVTRFVLPPCPAHYADFAALAAHIATAFPQVHYFVVWSELRDFLNRDPVNGRIRIDAAHYTKMYNDVYRAIKAARPDDQVGGPYVNLASYPTQLARTTPTTLHGRWGWLDPQAQNALSYWLSHNAGADFVAVDGRTAIASDAPGGPGSKPVHLNPLVAAEKYAAVDQWLRTKTHLPIWWMESHIAPAGNKWTEAQGAAARIATLAVMSASGASVGMQWQPQQQQDPPWPDEGLWTTTQAAGGGRPTPLSDLLPRALSILRRPTTVVPNQPPGVLVAKGDAGTLIVNTTTHATTARVAGTVITLNPAAVVVRPSTG